MLAKGGERWHIVLLTCRDAATDFRLPLAEELQALGHNVYYLYLKRRPVLIDMSGKEGKREFSLLEFLLYMPRKFRPLSPLLVFNSTNFIFPVLSRVLRLLCGGRWCFDMHDDLFYEQTGLARIKARIAQRILIGGSDCIVHAAPTLQERFPSSRHLGNASAMSAIERPNPDFRKVLVLASIDNRFDFAFLSATARANPDLSFDIFGQIAVNSASITALVDEMVGTAPNIHYHGPYMNSDLPRILGDYAVTLAPYVTQSPRTHYIDPLRYYHCLNSGMEVISTAIPKARDFGDVIHIVRAPEDVGPLVKRLADGSTQRRNAGSTSEIHNWRNRAVRLMEIIK